ncbi:thioredoxin [uncultured Alistipes sp.]|uniref:thioredoxin n=1 Tax=uncultured Alistipes sp. TaxID=538949 RepID=UPI002665D3E0|nr:thioredoxin [uncultured Alistipes sp.]
MKRQLQIITTMALAINKENYQEIISSEKPVVIDFWAEWCGPCRMVAPIIDELATEYEGRVVIGKCDVEENDDITMKYGVRNIPTIIFLKGGQLVDKQVGAASKDALKAKIEKLL